MKNFVLVLGLLVGLLSSVLHAADPIVQNLQDISVTVKAGYGQGSGVLFTRELENGDKISYVWTAAHVVDGLRKTRTVVVNGTSRTVVEFEDAQIVQEFKQDGRRIGEVKMEARVLRYSDANQGEDLAVLEVRKRNFTKLSVEFEDDTPPEIGAELYHVGSLLGQFGANSFTTGVMSQHGRVLNLGSNGVVFDQTTVTAFPGSSGGGVYLKKNGKYIGMLVRGAGEQFNFIVPMRRLREWAKTAKVEWAIDPKVPLPSPAELKKLPIEDAGVEFQAYDKAAATNKKFPFLIEIQPSPEPTLAPALPSLIR